MIFYSLRIIFQKWSMEIFIHNIQVYWLSSQIMYLYYSNYTAVLLLDNFFFLCSLIFAFAYNVKSFEIALLFILLLLRVGVFARTGKIS